MVGKKYFYANSLTVIRYEESNPDTVESTVIEASVLFVNVKEEQPTKNALIFIEIPE